VAFKLLDPAVVLPELDVVAIDHLPGAFPCTVIVIADEIDGLHEMTVTANKVRPIVRHDRRSLLGRFEFANKPGRCGGVHGGGGDLRFTDMAASGAAQGPMPEPGTLRGNALNLHA
jgi:hypothetical protein